MRDLLYVLIILLLFSNCENSNNQLSKDQWCEILINMDLSDQKYRGMAELSNPFFEVLDSLQSANDLTLEDYGKLPKDKQLEYGAKAKSIADKKPQIPQRIRDSLWNLQIQIDNVNTEKLIELVKNNGWPIKDGFRCEKGIGPAIIFRHSREEYWIKIQKLIDKELKEERISQGEYNLIDNHLKSRPSFNIKSK